MKWRGVTAKSSPVDDTPGVSEYQQNTRMRIEGELQRRWGMMSSAIAKQAGPIYNIASGSPASGNLITFGVFNAAGPSASVNGFGPPPVPPWQPPKRRKPIVPPPGSCTIWGPFSDAGTTGATNSYVLPAGSCSGTVSVSGMESADRSRTDNYGYSFTVTADAVLILSSGCLINSGAFIAIPPGALAISVVVTAGCAAGSLVGSWSISVTSP